MDTVTFNNYLRGRQVHSVGQARLLKVARTDPCWPEVKSLWQLLTYLKKQSAEEEVLDAARNFWRGFLSAGRRRAARAERVPIRVRPVR